MNIASRSSLSKNVDTIPNRVSIPLMLKTVAALLISVTTGWAQANSTAYDALRTVGNQLDREFVNRVISVSGVHGNPQPAAWSVIIADPNSAGGVREVIVENGRIVSQRKSAVTSGTTRRATIDPRKLNLDSSGAYEVADRTADSSHVPFALVSYTLRTDDRGGPIWIVTLENANRRPLGTIYIGANKGTVTRTEGMFAGAPMNAVVEDTREGIVREEEQVSDNPIMKRVRHMFYRARENAEDTFKRVRHNFADFIRGND